jgi:hypothetical protein
MPNNRNFTDALLKVSRALPASTSAVLSDGIDLEQHATGDFLAEVEFNLSAPALSTSQLPDTKVMVYSIEHDTDAAFGTVTTLLTGPTQTGAGGAGAAAQEYIFRLPTTAKRHVRLKITPSASGTGDASGVSATLQVVA